MAAAGDPIPELTKKIDVACRLLGEETSKNKLTREEFAECCGISVHALKECLRSDNQRMTTGEGRCLVDACTKIRAFPDQVYAPGR